MNNISFRIGQGYDVHRLENGRTLILGGVTIPCDKGLLGHSDADVLVHAIIDALLGAAGLGDIGLRFPDNDPKFRGISSLQLLADTHIVLTESNYSVVNVDATIVAELPKLTKYKDDMAKNIARVLHIKKEMVNIKATTEEGLGFTGTGHGIAAQAVCLIRSTDV